MIACPHKVKCKLTAHNEANRHVQRRTVRVVCVAMLPLLTSTLKVLSMSALQNNTREGLQCSLGSY
jgi:hypothetical protein